MHCELISLEEKINHKIETNPSQVFHLIVNCMQINNKY